jgi:hypothetical protein
VTTTIAKQLLLACAWSALAMGASAATVDAPKAQAAAAEDEVAYETVTLLPVEADITVADGRLAHLELTSDAPADIRAGMGQIVSGWVFAPTPAPVEASMRLVLRADRDGENYRVGVDNVTFHARKQAAVEIRNQAVTITPVALTSPRYPKGVESSGTSATVMLALRLGRDGAIEQVQVIQGALYEPVDNATRTRRALHLFEQAALANARKWKFAVEVHGEPDADDLTVVVPVRFAQSANENGLELGQWRRLARSARRAIAWSTDDPYARPLGVADMSGAGNAGAPVRLLEGAPPAR